MVRLLIRTALLLCIGSACSLAQWHQALARLTVYDAESCPYGHRSATGVRLRAGRHCAVDPLRIPYGSRILIPGVGLRIAVDTGHDVISGKAALVSGRNAAERSAVIIDIFVETRSDAVRLDRHLPLFAVVRWFPALLTCHPEPLHTRPCFTVHMAKEPSPAQSTPLSLLRSVQKKTPHQYLSK